MTALQAAGSSCPLKSVTGGAYVVGCFEHENEKGTTAAIVMNYEVPALDPMLRILPDLPLILGLIVTHFVPRSR